MLDVDHGYGKASTTLARNDLQMALQVRHRSVTRFYKCKIHLGQSFWATQILYKFTINLTKISILLLYLRVFTTDRRLRISVYCVLLLVVGYALGSIFATIFQCKPVSRAWNKKTDGNCISNTAFWYANAVANILGDCVILILPIPTIYRLQLPTNQKWGLVMIFAVGGL